MIMAMPQLKIRPIGQFLDLRVESTSPDIRELKIGEGWFAKGKLKFCYQKEEELMLGRLLKNICDII